MTFAKIRSYCPLFGKGCWIITGAKFLEEIQYDEPLPVTSNH